MGKIRTRKTLIRDNFYPVFIADFEQFFTCLIQIRFFLGVYKWNTYKGEPGYKAYYLNWNYGEPNDKFYEPLSGDCPGEDCIQIRKFSGNVTWHDLSCETKIPYICEKIRGNLLNLPFSNYCQAMRK